MANIVMKYILFFLLFSLSIVVASHIEARTPTPSKRFVLPNLPRQPAPSKRFVDSPSKRSLDGRAPAPGPSVLFVARDASPSKHLAAREPAPSKGLGSRSVEHTAPQKRGINEQHVVVEDSQRGFCLEGLMACPVLSTPGQFPRTFAEWEAVGFECVDFTADLNSCGGCSSLSPVEHDCTMIPHVQGVACVAGECEVSSCQPGYLLQSDGLGCTQKE